jgi:hypothetical protein
MNTLSRGSVKVNAYDKPFHKPTSELFWNCDILWKEVSMELHMNGCFLFPDFE